MTNKEIYLGGKLLKFQDKEVSGEFVVLQNEKYYKISNFNEMPDFFMTIVSSSDHWMFLSSTGSLTAGRKNRDNALFPYYQVDKIHAYKGTTGSRTYCLVEKEKRQYLWEPFSDESKTVYDIQRNLLLATLANRAFRLKTEKYLLTRF